MIDPETVPTEVLPVVSAEGSGEIRTERDRNGGRDRYEGRDRGGRDRDRGGRDRDRGPRRDDRGDRGPRPEAVEARNETRNETLPLVTEAPAEVAPIVVALAPEPAKVVEDVARAAVERADRGAAKGGKKKAEPTAETREFWETWAEEKSTRPAPAAAEAAPAAAEATDEGGERGGRSRGGRGRGGKDRGGRAEKPAATTAAAAKTEDKAERPSRSKRESAAPAAAPAPAATGDAGQARLFVSLGKKHGVSADDLRSLLAGPVGGDKARIGSVSLRDSHAHVRVPEDLVEAIIAGVHGTQHNDHDVTVERARA